MKSKKRKPRQSQPKSKLYVLRQVCELIPSHLVAKLANENKVKSRSFSPWSHVVSMLFAQFSAAISLNDVCDNLRNHLGLLSTIRGAKPPSRNGLSNANKKRDANMAKELFFAVLNHLQAVSPAFSYGPKRRKRGLPRRFKRTMHAIDSSTIKLVANTLHLADAPGKSPVTLETAEKAAALCDYFEAHAKKIYAPAINPGLQAAHFLAGKIKAGKIADGVPVREIYRRQWHGLTTGASVRSGLNVLEEFNWIRCEDVEPTTGRPSEIVRLNPALKNDNA